MAKLYFKFGTMGSSKTASALMCKFNYEQKGMKVLLLKPEIDSRDKDEFGNIVVKSRIGLSAPCKTFSPNDNLENKFNKEIKNDCSVVIVDECQFLTEQQVNQLKIISNKFPVLCYGLKTNFQSKLFEGSKRLLEIADSIEEIKSICECGKKAIINARMIGDTVVVNGDEIVIGNEKGKVHYEGMCFQCWMTKQTK